MMKDFSKNHQFLKKGGVFILSYLCGGFLSSFLLTLYFVLLDSSYNSKDLLEAFIQGPFGFLLFATVFGFPGIILGLLIYCCIHDYSFKNKLRWIAATIILMNIILMVFLIDPSKANIGLKDTLIWPVFYNLYYAMTVLFLWYFHNKFIEKPKRIEAAPQGIPRAPE